MTRDDAGSIALGVAVAAALVLVTMTGALLGSVAVVRARAGVAADLSALAAVTGGCETAVEIAIRNGGVLARCTWRAGEVEAEVALPAPPWLPRLGLGPTVHARARAGLG